MPKCPRCFLPRPWVGPPQRTCSLVLPLTSPLSSPFQGPLESDARGCQFACPVTVLQKIFRFYKTLLK